MQISSLGSSNASLSIQQLSSGFPRASDTSATSQGAGRVDVSKPAALMKKLSELQQSDPEKFKQVTAGMSEKLRAAAKQQTGAAADMLNKMADAFQQASTTGDVSALKPPDHKPQGGPPPGPPPDGAAPGAASSSTKNSNISAAAKYGQASRDTIKNVIDSVLQNALADVDTHSSVSATS